MKRVLLILLVLCHVILCSSASRRLTEKLPKKVRELTYIKTQRKLLGGNDKKKVFVIIDIQNDFVGGSLSVFNHDIEKGNEYVKKVADYMYAHIGDYDGVVYSIDFHPERHCSFASTYDRRARFPSPPEIYSSSTCNPKEQALWPDHCVQTNNGSNLHPLLPLIIPETGFEFVAVNAPDYKRVDVTNKYRQYINKQKPGRNAERKATNIKWDGTDNKPVIWLFKGVNEHIDSYSAFKGNDKDTPTKLNAKLIQVFSKGPADIELHVVGIAYEICVYNTIIDALELGYHVVFHPHLSASVVDNKGETIMNNGGQPNKEGTNLVIEQIAREKGWDDRLEIRRDGDGSYLNK